MVMGKPKMVNSRFLLQFTCNHLPFTFYETIRLFTFTFCLFTNFVSPVRRAAFDFEQTNFNKRRSANESADAAVKAFVGNVLDKF